MKGKLLFIIVLFTLTNIVKQMIENLHARMQVGWKILFALRKKGNAFVQVCMCKIKHWVFLCLTMFLLNNLV